MSITALKPPPPIEVPSRERLSQRLSEIGADESVSDAMRNRMVAGALKDARGEFLRDESGKIKWFRLGARARVRE